MIEKEFQESLHQQIHSISRIMTSYWAPQAIHAAVELRIFDYLQTKKTIEELHNATTINRQSLLLLLRALVSLNLISFENEKHFKLTKLGELLTTNHPHSLISLVKLWATEHYHAWEYLATAIKTGKEQFSTIYGKPFFYWLQDHPKKRQEYYHAMDIYANLDYKDLPKHLSLQENTTIIDIGGGSGALISQFYHHYQDKHQYILYDLPKVINEAIEFIKTKSPTIANTINFVSGDFFKDPIPQGDYYFLSRVLHDWNDDEALQILLNIKKNMPNHATLFLVERLLPDNMKDSYGALLNLNLLLIVGGRERTLTEYKTLLTNSNFHVVSVYQLSNYITVIEAKVNQ